jgi:hydroxymethylpyrimidine pyrophosphatase-like HAD family hydrolase
VDALVGENGAFYFYYDHKGRKMVRRYWKRAAERVADRAKLDRIADTVLSRVPGAAIASDQPYREADLAIDFCEDVPRLPDQQIDEIVRHFTDAGAQAKISSIHVNGWYGDYDKLSMTRLLFEEKYRVDLEEINASVVFIGDSPNDAPMFEYFTHSVGVANVRQFADVIETLPAWITEAEGGYGFSEMAEALFSISKISDENQ